MTRSALVLTALFMVGCGDNTPPEIMDVTTLQNTASTKGPYGVYATVVDDMQVKIVELRYKIDDDPEVILRMERTTGDVYYAAIPGQPVGSRVKYFVAASDGEQANEDIPTFPEPGEPVLFFDIVPEPTPPSE